MSRMCGYLYARTIKALYNKFPIFRDVIPRYTVHRIILGETPDEVPICQTARCHNPEDRTDNINRTESLTSYIVTLMRL
jgi:hypothetical protein